MIYLKDSTLIKSRFDINQQAEDPAYVAANPTATDRRSFRYVCRRMTDPVDLPAGAIVTVSGQEAITCREVNQWTIIGNGVRADGPLTVDLSYPPAAGLLGFREVAGGDLLPERFVAILFPCVG